MHYLPFTGLPLDFLLVFPLIFIGYRITWGSEWWGQWALSRLYHTIRWRVWRGQSWLLSILLFAAVSCCRTLEAGSGPTIPLNWLCLASTWIAPGLHLESTWIAYGVHMDYIWIATVLHLDPYLDTWIPPGFNHDHTWITPGFHMDCTWTAPGLHLDCTWITPGFHLGIWKNMTWSFHLHLGQMEECHYDQCGKDIGAEWAAHATPDF